MKLFYGSIEKDSVVIDEQEAHHISKVLRMQSGEKISVTDGKGGIAHGVLSLAGKNIILKVSKIEKNLPNNNIPRLHIAIALIKNMDRLEYFVEKSTEMGISEITFLLTENTERKNLNLNRIIKQSVAASKQSLRVYFPRINPLIKFSEFVDNLSENQIFIAHCDDTLPRISLSEIPKNRDYLFFIGPEGDFSRKEIFSLKEKNVMSVSLGKGRLRTETAGVLVSAWNCLHMNTGSE
ncbi:MAG: 16S rRNA (uracil(1498)-N(3))-methyltransferase [Bergeyella sp.]|nr:16S rRNA (uracil(1498)-N(3))-methyltransferase [Bergeyella sp.]